MRKPGSAEKSARTREQLAQLHEQYVAAKTRPTRNRLAWKLFRLILDPQRAFRFSEGLGHAEKKRYMV